MDDSVLDRIAENPERYSFEAERLGPCRIDSPVHIRSFVSPDEKIRFTESEDEARRWTERLGYVPAFDRAGPREKIFHDPSWTRAAVVTAGGLCPGLNNVIKGLVESLSFDYGVKTIYGIRFGYAGLNPAEGYEPMMLDPERVDLVHEAGGTVLGSSRGRQPADVIVDTLERMNVNILFCIGGDGSLRCAADIADECKRRNLKISVMGVPKTIDNDLLFIGRSFGFETAVAAATDSIRNAHVEARGTPHGVGLVKLMGRDSGFIAAYAAMANPVVNFCLVPEIDFELDGPHGLLAALERRFLYKDHAVVVVAEGAGQKFFEGTPEKDASGNVLKKDIGEYLKRRIRDYFVAKKIPSSVKYLDPSYAIRSVPARGTDAIRCYLLARSAVHAAMAGYTNCVAGNVGEWFDIVPIRLATLQRQTLDLKSVLWRGVMDSTCQDRYFGR